MAGTHRHHHAAVRRPPRPSNSKQSCKKSSAKSQRPSATAGPFLLDRLALFLLAVGVYSPSLLWASELVFDDLEAIGANRVVLGREWAQLGNTDFWGRPIRSPHSHKSFRPVTSLTFILESALFGPEVPPWLRRASNVLLHGLATVAVHTLVAEVAKAFGTGQGGGSGRVALWTGILFAVHPVHAEAVCQIVGRAELLLCLFAAGTLVLLMRTQHSPPRHCVPVLAFCSLSLLCKEQGIVLPSICALFHVVWSLRRQVRVRPLLLLLLAVHSGLSLFVRLHLQDFALPNFSPEDNFVPFLADPIQRLANVCWLWAQNVRLLCWPSQLCFDYSMGTIAPIESTSDPRLVPLVSALLASPFAAFAVIRLSHLFDPEEKSQLTFWSVFAVLFFLPSSHLLLHVGFVLAERVLYLPSIGFCLCVVLFAQKAIGCWQRHFANAERLAATASILVVAVLAGKCIQRSLLWNSQKALYSHDRNVCPANAKIHYNLGKVLADGGQLAEAELSYQRALALHPDYAHAMNNLALIWERRGKWPQAEAMLRKALRVQPNFAAAWMNLGIVQMDQGHWEASEGSFLSALQLRSPYPDCLFNLGNLYLRQSRTFLAKQCWLNTTRIEPGHGAAWLNLFILMERRRECPFLLEQLAPVALRSLSPHAAVPIQNQIALCQLQVKRSSEANSCSANGEKLDWEK